MVHHYYTTSLLRSHLSGQDDYWYYDFSVTCHWDGTIVQLPLCTVCLQAICIGIKEHST